jgi:hypothetical protein
MRLLAVVLAVIWCLLSRSCPATEVAGKWGIGVGTGDLIGSKPELSLLRGRSASTVWALDVSVNDYTVNEDVPDFYYPPGGDNERTSANVSWVVGPRLRKYWRAEETFSPYWDVYLRAVGGMLRQSSPGGSESLFRAGGEGGVALGAEYFFRRWPVSLAAHSTVASLRMEQQRIDTNPLGLAAYRRISRFWSGRVELSPQLQVRVYF